MDTMQNAILNHLDMDYSYRLAKRMEQFFSNPELGYRTAGSRAEFQTGEMLREEMERIGLSCVSKDAVTVDGWEFKRAALTFQTPGGERHTVQLGAYQTTFVTDGPEPFSLLYLGKGTEADYAGRDVTGKLVLVDINQRDEWWINYPVYQAHLKGARALIAVQSGGYGEIAEEALNAQDIAGPEDAPAFSISRRDAAVLKAMLSDPACAVGIPVLLNADTRVRRGCTTYNITGCIPGRHPERMILMSAHYDSYFSGFQDDNTAVAMMFGIAKALVGSGYRPNNTICICAMAAEEWGVADSNFDWSAGAYEQVFTAHPEWVGKVIADLNFELPALAHGTRARIRSCYEYTRYLEEYLSELPALTQAYPEETRVTAPIETWSDDFSMAIAGIPSMVNDFTGGSFMETHYHSQFDNDGYYDEQVYRLHHELFALLIEALDRTAVVPLCFAPVMERAAGSLDPALAPDGYGIAGMMDGLKALLCQAREKAIRDYEEIDAINTRHSSLLKQGRYEEADALFAGTRQLEQQVLNRFKTAQDTFVRIDWYGNVRYPHEILLQNLKLLSGAASNLRQGNLSSALGKLYRVDNNAYAFMFDEAVYSHFTDYVFHQPRERLKWGYGRLMPHKNFYGMVKSLLKKTAQGLAAECQEEAIYLNDVHKAQCLLLADSLSQIERTVRDTFL